MYIRSLRTGSLRHAHLFMQREWHYRYNNSKDELILRNIDQRGEASIPLIATHHEYGVGNHKDDERFG